MNQDKSYVVQNIVIDLETVDLDPDSEWVWGLRAMIFESHFIPNEMVFDRVMKLLWKDEEFLAEYGHLQEE